VLLSIYTTASTKVPEELAAGGNPSSASVRSTSEQAVPSADPKELTMVEAATEPRASKQVPPEAPSVKHAALKER
jgi:hypothetical protein